VTRDLVWTIWEDKEISIRELENVTPFHAKYLRSKFARLKYVICDDSALIYFPQNSAVQYLDFVESKMMKGEGDPWDRYINPNALDPIHRSDWKIRIHFLNSQEHFRKICYFPNLRYLRIPDDCLIDIAPGLRGKKTELKVRTLRLPYEQDYKKWWMFDGVKIMRCDNFSFKNYRIKCSYTVDKTNHIHGNPVEDWSSRRVKIELYKLQKNSSSWVASIAIKKLNPYQRRRVLQYLINTGVVFDTVWRLALLKFAPELIPDINRSK